MERNNFRNNNITRTEDRIRDMATKEIKLCLQREPGYDTVVESIMNEPMVILNSRALKREKKSYQVEVVV